MPTAVEPATRKTAPVPPPPAAQLVTSRGDLVLEMAVPGADGLPQEVRLFKAGAHESTKGTFVFDAESAKSVMAVARDYGNDYFFDYGHASLDANAVDPARAGRAAGTFRLQVINGELWTQALQWTEEAKQYLADRQYRYISPAFRHQDGVIKEFINCALTNMPATKGMTPIVMSRADEVSPQEQRPMFKTVLAALGLSDAASEAEALSQVQKLLARSKELMALTNKSDIEEAIGVLTGWKNQAAALAETKAKLEKLETEVAEETVQKSVRVAIKKGLIPPSLKEEALKVGRENPKFLKGFLSAFQPLVEGAGKGKKEKATEEVPQLTVALEKIARSVGLDPVEVAKAAQQTRESTIGKD